MGTNYGLDRMLPVTALTDFFCDFTWVSVGDGRNAKLWHDNWLDGMALKNLTPQLFVLVTRKNESVASECIEDRWISLVRNKITIIQIFRSLSRS